MFESNFEIVVVIHIIDSGSLLAKIKEKKRKKQKTEQKHTPVWHHRLKFHCYKNQHLAQRSCIFL